MFFDEVIEDIGISLWSVGEIEYVIEYENRLEKLIGLKQIEDPYGVTSDAARKLITSLSLFKSSYPGFLFTRSFEMLDIPIKPGGTIAQFPSVLVHGEAYSLVLEEISQFLEFWNFIKDKNIHNDPLNLALSRFNGAYGKFLPEDKIIDYAISFEALF